MTPDLSPTAMPRSASQILDDDFLVIRAKLIEIAASLDRIDAAGRTTGDDRRRRIERAIGLLMESDGNRAASIQRLFSRDYESDWRQKMDL